MEKVSVYGDVTILVSIGEIPGFVYIDEDENVYIVNDIKECTKWASPCLEEPYDALNQSRKAFPNLGLVAVRVPSIIFGSKPRRLIE